MRSLTSRVIPAESTIVSRKARQPKLRLVEDRGILPHSDIAELFFSVWYNRRMTQAHRQELMSVLLTDTLNESDYRLIDRLLHAVRRGWVKIVN